MRSLFFCFTGLLIITAATSPTTATITLENSSIGSNNAANATLKEAILSNASSNLLAVNDSAINGSNSTRIVPKNATFMIGGDAKVKPTDDVGIDLSADACINASAGPSEALQSNKTAFKIKGYTRPTRDAKKGAQCSLTAACLSRGVEGTPHGYVTYYN